MDSNGGVKWASFIFTVKTIACMQFRIARLLFHLRIKALMTCGTGLMLILQAFNLYVLIVKKVGEWCG